MSTPLTWSKSPPPADGDYFYTGPVPGGPTLLAIVAITTMPDKRRFGSLLLPPYWREDANRTQPVLHIAALEEWPGEWAGPEGGLCVVVNPR